MANLEFLTNVVHQGIILKTGMIVSDVENGLAEVGHSLIARGLAKETTAPRTHSTLLVNGVQEPMAVTAPSSEGQTPNTVTDEARKAAATDSQVPADAATVNQVNDTATAEAKVVTPQQAPNLLQRAKDLIHQPTAEEIAATAAQVQ